MLKSEVFIDGCGGVEREAMGSSTTPAYYSSEDRHPGNL